LARFALSLWKPMAIGLAAGCLLGIAAYLYLGPTYEAHTQIKVSKKASLPMNDAESRRYGDRGEHVYLIKSDAICRRALEDFGLKNLPAFKGGYDPVQDLVEGITVKRIAGQDTSFDNLIDISYQHPDKEVAKKVVEAIVKAYDAYLESTKDTNSRELYDTITGQLKTIESDILSIEDQYHGWRNTSPFFMSTPVTVSSTGTPIVGPSPYMIELEKISAAIRENMLKRTAVEAKRRTLNDMLARNESREAMQVWVLWSLSTGTASSSGGEGGGGGGGGGGAILASPPGKAELDTQLMSARLLEHRLLQVLGPNHNDVANVHSQIDAILKMYRQNGFAPPVQGKLGEDSTAPAENIDLTSIYSRVLEDQLNELASAGVLLDTRREQAMEEAKKGMSLDKEDQDWKERISDKKKFRDDLQNKLASYTQTRDQEGYRLEQISTIRVEKSMKRMLKIIGPCAFLGIVAVFGLAYFREWYDTSLRSLDEVRDTVGAQVLGAVPGFHVTPDMERLLRNSRLHPQLCYSHRPGSREAEAYRTVRTALLFAVQEAGAQLIQVSSPEPGDGKTTSISNLAIAIAQSGKRVLLIDADLRRPTVHEMFRVSQEAGLSEVLHGEIEWMNALKTTPFQTLSILTAGIAPENPAELLSSPALETVLRRAREEFDFVLVDSPPVLAVSDPSIIAPHTDGMLLVVRMRKNKRPAVERTRETLDSYGVRLFGVIANDFSASANREGYSYDSYDVYYRQPREPEKEAVAEPVTA
jgi:capsular exopolysaccharide synthesis family protein